MTRSTQQIAFSNFASNEDEAATHILEESATKLYRRYVDHELFRVGTDRTSDPLFEGELRITDPVESYSKDRLPENLAERIAERPSDMASFNPLQEWDGYVVEVNATFFRGRLIDITNDDAADEEEEVEIQLSELDEDSQSQLAEGRLFRWSIGYQWSRTGQKTRVSRIIVRRLPAWSVQDIEAAKGNARELSRKLKWQE